MVSRRCGIGPHGSAGATRRVTALLCTLAAVVSVGLALPAEVEAQRFEYIMTVGYVLWSGRTQALRIRRHPRRSGSADQGGHVPLDRRIGIRLIALLLLLFWSAVTSRAQVWTDDPLVPGRTPIKAMHIVELRSKVNDRLTECGTAAFSFTDPTLLPGSTPIRAVHVAEIREALNHAYRVCERTPLPMYTDRVLDRGPIRATHITELRAAVFALENIGAPRRLGSMPPLTLVEDGDAAIVDAAQYFLDPDGDALTYAAASSDVGTVAASTAGSVVTIRPLATGTAIVTVTAYDPAGLAATQDLVVGVSSPATENVLAALIDFLDTDDRSTTLSREEILNLLVHNDDSLKNFIWKTSRNLVSVDFDVLDRVTVGKSSTDYPPGSDDVIPDAVSAISDRVDLSRYDKVLLFVSAPVVGCAAYLEAVEWRTPNGVFDLGAAWLGPGCEKKGRIAHEFGHTFGFRHSLHVDCVKDPPLPASLIDPTDKSDSCYYHACADAECTETTPTNAAFIANADWDMLGGDHDFLYEQMFPLHYQAAWQAHAGWLRHGQVTTVDRSGSYVITTLESLDSRPKAVRISLGSDYRGERLYYLLQTREFSPWGSPWGSDEGEYYGPCQVDVRLQSNGIFTDFGQEDVNASGTFFFNGSGESRSNGTSQRFLGHPFIRWNVPFRDPYRGIHMEMTDCVEKKEATEIKVAVDFTGLNVDPPVVARLQAGRMATLVVTNGSIVPVSVGSVSIGGRHPAAFSLLADGCSLGVLGPAASCGVTVKNVSAERDVAGNPNHHAVLRIPNDDRLAPELSVSLLGDVSVLPLSMPGRKTTMRRRLP